MRIPLISCDFNRRMRFCVVGTNLDGFCPRSHSNPCERLEIDPQLIFDSMKRTGAIWGLLLALLGALPLHGQGSASAEMTFTISAEVQSTAIELITLQSMDFRGMGAQQLQLQVNPLTSERAGKMVALGDPNSSFRISFLQTRDFTNVNGSGVIRITYRVAGYSMDEQENADELEVESRELVFNEDGEFYFWVGGLVNLERATPGSYEGEFTLEIEYL